MCYALGEEGSNREVILIDNGKITIKPEKKNYFGNLDEMHKFLEK